MLTAAREERGLSIQDAAHETRIDARWIRLLEEGNVAAFGSITYARSFVRAYSVFLGVDASEYLLTLPTGGVLGGHRDYRYLVHSYGPWLREREGQSPERQRSRLPNEPKLRRIKCPIPAGIGVFVLMLTATAMWGMHVTAIQSHAHTQPEPFKPLPVVRANEAPRAQFAQLRTPAQRPVD